jgi:hypothetical protein
MTRRFEVHDLGYSRPMNGHRAWRGSSIWRELPIDLDVELLRAVIERRRAVTVPPPAERTDSCSRCRRPVADGGGRSPARSWCRECEAARVKKARARRAAR